MKPADLLRAMRSKGYELARDGAKLSVSGPPPRDPAGAKVALDTNRAALLALLDAEAHPVVRGALDVFPDGRVVEFRPTREAHLGRIANDSSLVDQFPTDQKSVSARRAAG